MEVFWLYSSPGKDVPHTVMAMTEANWNKKGDEYNSGSNSYSQKGQLFLDSVDHMGLGRSVTLKYDGTILGIGTYTY